MSSVALAPAPQSLSSNDASASDLSVLPKQQTLHLTVRFPDRTTKRFPISKAVVTIGREQDNDVVLPFEYVSAYHAELQRQFDGSYQVVDLGSYNSTGKNGHKVERAKLKSGDVLVFGILGAMID